ncbi:MAG: 3-dehydroquinate synthase, partial [Candidatus Aenigmatarchaeota archaeon]
PSDLPDISGTYIITHLERDKKIRDGKIRFVLTEGIGCVRLRPVEAVELLRYFPQIKGWS